MPMHTLDLTNADLQKLALSAGRIAALLQKPGTMANKDVVAVLDDLLGAVYAAIACLEEGFVGKAGESEMAPALDRAKQVASGVIKTHGNWMAGFHFNSGMFRISAVFDRMPKALAGGHASAAAQYKAKTGHDWVNTNAHLIRDEVNRVKHDADGVFKKREQAMGTLMQAFDELLHLAETLS
jgi:hypothetical protein